LKVENYFEREKDCKNYFIRNQIAKTFNLIMIQVGHDNELWNGHKIEYQLNQIKGKLWLTKIQKSYFHGRFICFESLHLNMTIIIMFFLRTF